MRFESVFLFYLGDADPQLTNHLDYTFLHFGRTLTQQRNLFPSRVPLDESLSFALSIRLVIATMGISSNGLLGLLNEVSITNKTNVQLPSFWDPLGRERRTTRSINWKAGLSASTPLIALCTVLYVDEILFSMRTGLFRSSPSRGACLVLSLGSLRPGRLA